MSVLASDILGRAGTICLDETNVRWPLVELCKWLNDGQREIVVHKPASLARNVPFALGEGTMQTVPAEHLGLLRIIRNLSSPVSAPVRIGGRTIRVVSREILDGQNPDWHNPDYVEYRADVRHYVVDEQDPMTFYVYPGNDGTGVIEVVFAGNPKDVKPLLAADPTKIEAYAVPLEFQDPYGNALLDYVLYRAYSKDAQFAGNAQRAAAHYTQFANLIGLKVQNDLAVSPNYAAQQKAS